MVQRVAGGLVAVALVVAGRTAPASDIEDARPMALAGASRAICGSNDAIYLNPAGISLGRIYHVESSYTFVPTRNGHIAGASVVDSVSAPVGAGLSFNYLAWDPDGEDRSEYDVRLAVSYAIARFVMLGVSVKYIYADRNGRGPLGGSLFESNGEAFLNTVTLDAGVMIRAGRFFSLGVAGYNLTDTGSAFAPLALGGGVAVTIGRSFVAAADVLVDFTTRDDIWLRYMGGAEYFVANHYPLRVGYRYDDLTGRHAISAGIGYIDQRFAAEFGMRQDVYGDELDTVLNFSVRYFAN